MKILIQCSLFILFVANVGVAQSVDAVKSEKNEKIKIVPYANYNRTYGGMFGIVPVAMYKLKKTDAVSPPSITGAFGIYTTNKSYIVSAFSKFFFNEDKWRISAAFGTGNIQSQFFMAEQVGGFVDYASSTDFLFVETHRQLVKNVYAAVSYTYSKFENTFELAQPVEETVELNGLGVGLTWDKRDNVYYPRSGHFINVRFTAYPEFFGNDDVTQLLKLKVNKYISLRDQEDILALRLFLGLGLGEVPFNKELKMSGVDLRGYTQGEFRGRQKIDIQGEYRYNFGLRIGAVGFVGVGAVFNSMVEDNNGVLLPSIGAGIRYKVFEKNDLNVGFDVAAGKNDWGVYFRLAEAF